MAGNFLEVSVSTHTVHDNDMANATPRRKMFSTIPVSNAQYTEDNQGGNMAMVRSLAKAIKKDGKLKTS